MDKKCYEKWNICTNLKKCKVLEILKCFGPFRSYLSNECNGCSFNFWRNLIPILWPRKAIFFIPGNTKPSWGWLNRDITKTVFYRGSLDTNIRKYFCGDAFRVLTLFSSWKFQIAIVNRNRSVSNKQTLI